MGFIKKYFETDNYYTAEANIEHADKKYPLLFMKSPIELLFIQSVSHLFVRSLIHSFFLLSSFLF